MKHLLAVVTVLFFLSPAISQKAPMCLGDSIHMYHECELGEFMDILLVQQGTSYFSFPNSHELYPLEGYRIVSKQCTSDYCKICFQGQDFRGFILATRQEAYIELYLPKWGAVLSYGMYPINEELKKMRFLCGD